MRSTTPSTMATVPKTMPDRMLSTVYLPIDARRRDQLDAARGGPPAR